MKSVLKRLGKPIVIECLCFLIHLTIVCCFWWVLLYETQIKALAFVFFGFVCAYLNIVTTDHKPRYYRWFVIVALSVFILLHVIYTGAMPHASKVLTDLFFFFDRLMLPYVYSVCIFPYSLTSTIWFPVFYWALIVLISILSVILKNHR